MFESNRRGTLVWAAIMALAAFLFFSSGELGALMIVSAISAILLLLLFISQGPLQQLQDALPAPQRVAAASPTARTARLQASHRPDYDEFYGLQDVGLIVDEPRTDGLHLRRARLVSLDDEAIRPYLVVHTPSYGHPAQVIIRFEINDASGASQFVYEMDYYMRPGENAVLPDYRLPLKGNQRLDRTGKWDLQVWINGGLVAVHTFSVTPSVEERRRQFGIDGEAQQRLELDNEPVPMSLEELLARQSGESSSR